MMLKQLCGNIVSRRWELPLQNGAPSRDRRRLLRALGIVPLSMVGACSSTSARTDMPQELLVETEFFVLNGRLSVRTRERSDSVKMVWTKSAIEERWDFFSPFGSQVADAVRDVTGTVTWRRDKETVRAPSIEALTQSLLGVAFDTDPMGGWVQGVGLIEDRPRDMPMRNATVWRVLAERFRIDTTGRHRYAERITAVRDDITVKLVVDEWRAL